MSHFNYILYNHIILHLYYFTLCRLCIYMPYIRVHKLFYFIYYRQIMQCFISIICCHYYSFIGIPLYSRINQCVSVIPASHAWNGFFHIQITNKQKRLLIYSKLHWNHLMCMVKAYQMQQVNVSKLNDNFNCTTGSQWFPHMLSGLHRIFASTDMSHFNYILYKQFLHCTNGYSLALLTFTIR